MTYYPLTDIQGNVWGYVDSQNNVVARWQYDAWGNVISEEVAPSAAALARLRYRFQGREWSAATGLINFRMRWYDAETGRWLSKDPIGLHGGLNQYLFCYGDSINFIDDDGLAVTAIGVGAVAIAVAYGLSYVLSHMGGRCAGERGWAARPDGTANPVKNFGLRKMEDGNIKIGMARNIRNRKNLTREGGTDAEHLRQISVP